MNKGDGFDEIINSGGFGETILTLKTITLSIPVAEQEEEK